MKSCKDCNEYSCGGWGSNDIALFCGDARLELEFYRDYILKNDLLYDALNQYEKWKKEHGHE